MDREQAIEELKTTIVEYHCFQNGCYNCGWKQSRGDCEEEHIYSDLARHLIEDAGYSKADDIRKQTAEEVRKENENLRRTLTEGRNYEYRDSCAGCELESVCKYSEHYNFCEDCKDYPECPCLGYETLPCGRHIECNNGFEEKSDFDDEDDEGEDDEVLIIEIDGVAYFIADIGMRMLKAEELKLAQGFPKDYIIAIEPYIGKKYSEAKQIARLGNAVCPPVAKALILANCEDMALTKSIDTMAEVEKAYTYGSSPKKRVRRR